MKVIHKVTELSYSVFRFGFREQIKYPSQRFAVRYIHRFYIRNALKSDNVLYQLDISNASTHTTRTER